MALIDRIKFDGMGAECEDCGVDARPGETRCPRCGKPFTPRAWLVYKFPSEDLTLGAQLIVNQGQEAVFFKGGQALDVFGPGTHTLATENLPLLRKLVNLPFGGKTPFTAEVYYINKTSRLDMPWGTASPFQVMDPRYKILVRVRAHGQFGLRIKNARSFIAQLAGAMQPSQVSDYQTVSRYFKGLVVSRVSDTLAGMVVREGTSVLELTAHVEQASLACQEKVAGEFDRFGIEVVNFFIEALNVPDEDLAKLKGALNDRAEFDILGDDRYTRKRTLDVLETGAGNPGAAGEGLGTGLGLGMGLGAAGALGGLINNLGKPAGAPAAGVKCPACGALNPAEMKFCGQCGARIETKPLACPNCKQENPPGMKFCGHCGTSLAERNCPSCGQANPPGMKFCGKCGTKLEGAA